MRLNETQWFLIFFLFTPQLLMNKQIGLKRYEVDGRKVLFYFDEVMDLFLIIMLDFDERQRSREWGRVLGVPQGWGSPCSFKWPLAWASFAADGGCGFAWKPKYNRGRWFTSAHGVVLVGYHLDFCLEIIWFSGPTSSAKCRIIKSHSTDLRVEGEFSLGLVSSRKLSGGCGQGTQVECLPLLCGKMCFKGQQSILV